ncbi:MAG: penicillin acylase family protein [Spirochaetes bacterium]|nr:penicillin acylase family protein [Spirochaetota bacterium]
MKKKILIAGISVAAAVLLAGAGWLVLRHTGRISYSGSFTGAVKSQVALERDAAGIPLIKANTMGDAYYGLGYLHCQDRYAMMEYFRAIASGSAAQIIGKDGPSIDRLSRALGFARKGRDMAPRLREPYAGYLRDYVRGVNAGRARLDQKDAVKRQWTPEDVIAVLLLREWANAFLNNRETRFYFSRDEISVNLKTIIPEELIFYYSENESECAEVIRRLKRIVKRHIGSFDVGFAMYLPEQKMKDKYAVTAFNFDDELSRYPGWYPVHIQADDRYIKAITHAGFPFLFAGNNLYMTFFGFNAAVDVQDFIGETVARAGKTYQYLGPGGWSNFNIIKDRGSAINATENGPVLNDMIQGASYGTTVVTVRSFFCNEDYIVSLFEVPLSKSIEEAEGRIKGVISYPRVYLFSTDETAVRAWSGMAPNRPKTDTVFRTGADAAWNGMTDLSAFREKAEQGIAAGSAFLAEAPEPVRDFAIRQDGRYERAKQIMERKKRYTYQDIGNAITDKYSVTAGRFLPVFLSILGDNPMASSRLTRIYFQNWKCRMKTDFVGPSIFHMLLQKFMYETYRDELKDRINDVMEHWDLMVPQFYDAVKEGKSPFFDDATTYAVEYRETVFDRSFLGTMRFFNRKVSHDINDWSWGNVHRGHFTIPGSEKQHGDMPFHGSFDSLNLGTVGLDLKPATVTSLSGFFGMDESFMLMNYAYSTDPRSQYFYATAGPLGIAKFHEVKGRSVITISPEKK